MLTREYLINRGTCCGLGCLMCPFDPPHTEGSTKVWNCNPEGKCWCKDLPVKLEVKGDKCLSPSQLKKITETLT